MKSGHKTFRGKLLNVFLKKFRLPNGYLATFEIVKHRGAVLVAPLLATNKVILLRQLRPVIGRYIYELPAGTLEKQESPLACVKREIIEETGYSAKKITKLGEIFPVPGYSTEKIIIYKAEKLAKMKQAHQQDEVIEAFIYTKRQIQKLFKQGKIVDAKTICAFALCGWLKGG
jgi:ADP-ribose pyrophosphatase